MLRRWLLYLSILTGVLIFHSYYTGWLSEYLLWFTLALPVFSLLLSLPGMLRSRLETNAPEEVSRTQAVQMQFSLSGKSFFPVARCKITSELYDRMTGQKLCKTCILQADGAGSLLLPTEHCTCWDWTLRKGRVYDFLGLFFLPVRAKASHSIYFLPIPKKPEQLPDLSRFLAPRLTPKPGGGFSEQHELREYRPGDPLRQIHWKLTAKTDKLIVREPMQTETGRLLLTFDLCLPQQRLDQTLDALVWLSEWMLEQGIGHSVCWLDPETLAPESRVLSASADWRPLLRELLAKPLSSDLPSIAGYPFPQASLCYFVSDDAEGEAEQ